MRLDTTNTKKDFIRLFRGVLFAGIYVVIYFCLIYLMFGDSKLPRKTEEALYGGVLPIIICGFIRGVKNKKY